MTASKSSQFIANRVASDFMLIASLVEQLEQKDAVIEAQAKKIEELEAKVEKLDDRLADLEPMRKC